MAIDLDLKCQLCERRASRSAQPNPRHSPVLPRPMHNSHCVSTAWGEGRGEGKVRGQTADGGIRSTFTLGRWTFVSMVSCSWLSRQTSRDELSFHVPSPLTPALPTRRTLKRTVAWGEGGLSVALGFGAAHGVHSMSCSARFADGFVSVRDPVHRSQCPNSSARREPRGPREGDSENRREHEDEERAGSSPSTSGCTGPRIQSQTGLDHPAPLRQVSVEANNGIR
jgi:hypothetical protein